MSNGPGQFRHRASRGTRRARALVCCAGLGLIGAAGAFTGASTFGNGVSVVTPARITAAEVISNASGSARAVGAVDLIGPGGRAAIASAGVSISARGALAVGAKFLPYALPLSIAYEVYRAVRVKPGASAADPLMFDEGQAETLQQQMCTDGRFYSATNGSGTPGGYVHGCGVGNGRLCSAIASSLLLTSGVWSRNCSVSGAVLTIQTTNQGANYTGSWNQGTWNITVSNANWCPGYTDGWTGAVVPPGEAKDADGKCNTGSYTKPMTAQEAADAAAAHAASRTLDYAGLLREALGQGPIEIPAAEAAGKLEGTMPSVPGAVTETVKPDGSTEVQTQAYDLAPGSGDTWPIKGTWRDKTTTTTKNAQGQTTGTTTTTTTPPTAANGDPLPTDPTDPCTADPGRLGCIGLGTAPTETTPKRTFTLSWAEESLSLPSGCPSPQALPGLPAVDYTPMCDAATRIRPFVLIGAAFSALMLVVATLRGA